MTTPRYSYVVRPSTMYHSSTVYERASRYPARLVYWPGWRRACWAARGAGSERPGGAPVKTDGEVGGIPEAGEASEASGTAEHDDEQWPFFRYPRQYPRSGREAREEARE